MIVIAGYLTIAPEHRDEELVVAADALRRSAAGEERRMIADGSLPPNELGKAWHERLWGQVALVMAAVPDDQPAEAVGLAIVRELAADLQPGGAEQVAQGVLVFVAV